MRRVPGSLVVVALVLGVGVPVLLVALFVYGVSKFAETGDSSFTPTAFTPGLAPINYPTVVTETSEAGVDGFQTAVAAQTLADCRTAEFDRGDSNKTLRSGDLDRTYIVHIPPQYDGFVALPLVLNLHGYGLNARNEAAYSRLPQKADEAAFIVVTPDGAGTPQQWNNLQLPELPDDVAFIGELLDHLEATLCVDPARLYATGISNGSAFAQRLACLMPDRIAAVAAVAAFVYPVVCDTAPPVPIIAFHGTADRCVPYEGGVTTCGRGNLPVPAVETAAANWARHDSCATEPARSQVSPEVRAIAYSECDDDVAVVLYAVEGGGHTWPGSIDVPRLGAVTTEVDATELMWEFFEAH